MTSGDAAMIAQAAQLYEDCKNESGADACETASKIGICLKDKGQKMKLMFGP